LVRGKGYTRRGTNKSVNEPKNRTHCVCLSVEAERIIRKLMKHNHIKIQGISSVMSKAVIKTYDELTTLEYCEAQLMEEQLLAKRHYDNSIMLANEIKLKLEKQKKINEWKEGGKK